MGTRRTGNVAQITIAAIAVLLQACSIASAQDVTEPALKAAFILNFARFTEWPANVVPPTEPLAICVLGDPAVRDELERLAKGRAIAGHRVAVSLVTSAGPKGVCHVLYVSGVTASQASQLVIGLRDLAVLTISDIDGFVPAGGIAQFFFEHGMLRFSVDALAAKRAQLQISSRLLALARNK